MDFWLRSRRAVSRVKRVLRPLVLRQRIRLSDPIRLVIGAGGTSQSGWISTDRYDLDLLRPDQWRACLGSRKARSILAEHVWEHLTPEGGVSAARTCWSFLEKGGRVRIAVPDGHFPDPAYIESVRPGGSGPGCEDHHVLYTYRTLTDVFEKAGFQVRLLEYFDESGQFHREDWDIEDGMILRSQKFDERNQDGKLRYTSIILDGIKP